MALTILLTAGGTREAIDDVRYVSNAATGALPAAMADVLLAQGHHVHYLHGPGALLPGHARLDLDLTQTDAAAVRAATAAWLDKALQTHAAVSAGQLTLHPVSSAAEVLRTLTRLCGDLQPDAVGCAMAVADYSPAPASGKLSSERKHVTLRMKATAKAIDAVKRVAPDTWLLGFKLLSQASDADLCDAALRQMQRAGSDLVFCNDMQDLNAGRRRGLVVGAGGVIVTRLDGGTGPEGLRNLAAALVKAWLEHPGRA